MRARAIFFARTTVGVGVLVFIGMRVGVEPFEDAMTALRGPGVVLGLAVCTLTTFLCVWRWRVVASSLGIPIPMRAAVAAYYQSQFLDATLPGGVLGDLHRGVRHGRSFGAMGRGLRAVVWERSLGQVVQLWLAVVVVLLLPSPVRAVIPRGIGPLVVALMAEAVAVGAVLLRGEAAERGGMKARALSTLRDDARRIVWAAPGSLTRIVLAATGAVMGHSAMFVIAARVSGVSVPLDRLLPLTLVVIVASGLPVNVAGWGPREGAAAWAFGAAGLGAAQGVTTAVAYGVMGLVATLPGAIVLVAERPLHAPAGGQQVERQGGAAPSRR
jgi:hypothetical protein